jgi:hypothetical protein
VAHTRGTASNDSLLPSSFYPVNEFWNLLPVDRTFNQRIKRNCLPSAASLAARSGLVASYTYG